jgi:hypothetical protein
MERGYQCHAVAVFPQRPLDKGRIYCTLDVFTAIFGVLFCFFFVLFFIVVLRNYVRSQMVTNVSKGHAAFIPADLFCVYLP